MRLPSGAPAGHVPATGGRAIFVSTGLIQFTETDAELAIVIGHGLAHAACGHLGAKRRNAFPGALADAAYTVATGNRYYRSNFAEEGIHAFSQEF